MTQRPTPKERWAAPEPPEPMVWAICPYTRDQEPCAECPAWEVDGRGERFRRGCYVMAAGACRVVFAMQAREVSQ